MWLKNLNGQTTKINRKNDKVLWVAQLQSCDYIILSAKCKYYSRYLECLKDIIIYWGILGYVKGGITLK